MKICENIWNWIFGNCKSNDATIWEPVVTSELSPLIFETEPIWAIYLFQLKQCFEQNYAYGLRMGLHCYIIHLILSSSHKAKIFIRYQLIKIYVTYLSIC